MGTFINSPVTVGNNNVVKVVHTENDNLDWEGLKKECLAAIQKLPQGSEEREAVEMVFADAVRKDKGSLRATACKFAAALSSKLFCSVAGSVLAEVVKSVISQ